MSCYLWDCSRPHLTTTGSNLAVYLCACVVQDLVKVDFNCTYQLVFADMTIHQLLGSSSRKLRSIMEWPAPNLQRIVDRHEVGGFQRAKRGLQEIQDTGSCCVEADGQASLCSGVFQKGDSNDANAQSSHEPLAPEYIAWLPLD